ncbi:MAG: hypothetical protein IPO19_12820 [Rhodoferax sp.]|nr:hypothetical protein [Rhodoferax sp.]
MHIDTEDALQLLGGVARFARERIVPLAARPQCPIDADQLALLTQEALELGILPRTTPDEGFGIWEHTDAAQAMRFNIGALRLIAHASPGVAFAWHRMALARWISARLGPAFGASGLQGMLLVPTGHYGLAATAGKSGSKAGALSAHDTDMLSDWLDRGAHTPRSTPPQGLARVWSGQCGRTSKSLGNRSSARRCRSGQTLRSMAWMN